jgi:arylformamidase
MAINQSIASGWIDISVPVYSGMAHWPDNPPIKVELSMSIERGDVCNVSDLTMGSHTGTHMDAPFHFVDGGKTIDEMPLDAAIGPARVIEIQDPEFIKREELESHHIRSGERILFKTSNSIRCWNTDDFVEEFVNISPDAARYLAELGVRLVGVDYLSVGSYTLGGTETHRALLQAGIWLIEGLNLSGVQEGRYELICLPLRTRHGDGAPARAVLRAL